MATKHDDTHGPVSGTDVPESEGMNKTLIIQGAIFGGFILLLVLASVFDLI